MPEPTPSFHSETPEEIINLPLTPVEFGFLTLLLSIRHAKMEGDLIKALRYSIAADIHSCSAPETFAALGRKFSALGNSLLDREVKLS